MAQRGRGQRGEPIGEGVSGVGPGVGPEGKGSVGWGQRGRVSGVGPGVGRAPFECCNVLQQVAELK